MFGGVARGVLPCMATRRRRSAGIRVRPPRLPQDATGTLYDGVNNAAIIDGVTYNNWIQPDLANNNGAPFPIGHIRLKNAGQVIANGQMFDILITVPEEMQELGSNIELEYRSPAVPVSHDDLTKERVRASSQALATIILLTNVESIMDTI